MSSVLYMSRMFTSASAFNQDISAWDVSKAGSFYKLFMEASSFNHGYTHIFTYDFVVVVVFVFHHLLVVMRLISLLNSPTRSPIQALAVGYKPYQQPEIRIL